MTSVRMFFIVAKKKERKKEPTYKTIDGEYK